MAVSSPLPTFSLGQHVIVRSPSSGARPATVVGAEGGALTLILAEPSEPLFSLEREDVVVEWTSGLGVRRCRGVPLAGGERRELLRVELSAELDPVQRRRWSRAEATMPVRVKVIDEPGVGGETTTLNVSGGGVLLRDPWRLRVGAGVWVELLLEGCERPIRALGHVVREADMDHKGVRFDDIPAVDQERIARFVRACKQEQLALKLANGF